jgi:geranylgeranyl diphosphate synthase type II
MDAVNISADGSVLGGYLRQLQEHVERSLSNYLPRVSKPSETTCPPRLASAMRYSTLDGGKRLRAILCLMATDACGCESKLALPAACALEMVHSYSLIHDDLPAMDNDDLRRSRLTCHRAYDEATAILAGDSLLTLAFEILACEIKPEAVALRCITILAEASGAIGMVGGQMADLELGWRSTGKNREPDYDCASESAGELFILESIHARKTGQLLCAPLRMGAAIARAPKEYVDALSYYGKAVGLAFQIMDDLLDVEGEESKLGKRVGKDYHLGKWTYPRFLGVDESRHWAQQLANEAILAIAPLGPNGDNLRCLARALLKRDR